MCKTWEAKREIALKLATNKTASFTCVTQTESLKSNSEVSDVNWWLHIWEIADVGKFPHRPSDEDMMAKLMRFVSDCLSRPSEKPELAADVELQYDYHMKQVTKHSVVRSSEVAAKSETTTDEQGFHEAKDAINSEARAVPMSTKTKSKKNHALRHRVVLSKTTKPTKCFRRKRSGWKLRTQQSRRCRKLSTISKRQWNNLKPLSRKGRAATVFVSKSYITKMTGGGKALETWKTKIAKELANVEKLTEDTAKGSPTVVMSML